jgi:lambda family phage portal protein
MGDCDVDALTRILAAIAPALAARRVAALAKLAHAQRYYEAVKITAQRPRRGGPQSADAVVDAAKGNLRNFSRNLDENHDLAIGVLDDLVTNVVGVGAGIEAMAVRGPKREPAEELNHQLTDLWAEFWERPEVTGELSGPEMERLVCRSWLRDGEVFAQHVTAARAPYFSRVPYALELLESDFLPFDLTRPADRVTHGVQKDGWNRPVGYWFSKTHPGAQTFNFSSSELIWKPAESIVHLKFVRRLHQTRGVSVFHGVLTRLDDLKDYEESERIAARVAAALTAYIKRDIGLSADAAVAGEDSLISGRSFAMEPGLVFDGLMPGEDVGTIDSKRPNPNLEQFRNAMLRAVAAGTGTRFSSIAKDYNGTYSAQRQELVEAVAHYRRLFDYLRARFYRPVWRRFVDSCRLAGLLRIPAGVDLFSLYHPEIRPPNMPWIDPLKEIKAYQAMVEGGFRSRHQVIRDLGSDPATVDAQLEADPLDIRPLPEEPNTLTAGQEGLAEEPDPEREAA